MATIIYPSPVFGPVSSRRLGVSLGINLQPADGKLCTFDCIYCECGLNAEHRPRLPRPKRKEVAERLEQVLVERQRNQEPLDDICFAGNGEPTAHPEFEQIVSDVVALRDRYFPQATVSVLSNATMLDREGVRRALLRVDNNMLKLDTVAADYIQRVNQPVGAHYDVETVVRQMAAFGGSCMVQTLFMKGTAHGVSVDNTSDRYVLPWLQALRAIRPKLVAIYTIDRETPLQTLEKATPEELDRIRDLVRSEGFPCTVGY